MSDDDVRERAREAIACVLGDEIVSNYSTAAEYRCQKEMALDESEVDEWIDHWAADRAIAALKANGLRIVDASQWDCAMSIVDEAEFRWQGYERESTPLACWDADEGSAA